MKTADGNSRLHGIDQVLSLTVWLDLVGLSWYSVINSWLLQTWTSAALSTNQDALRGPWIASIFGCQLCRVGILRFAEPVEGFVEAVSFRRVVFDPFGLLPRREYLAQSSSYFRKQRSGKWVVMPLSIHSWFVHVSSGARWLTGFEGLALRGGWFTCLGGIFRFDICKTNESEDAGKICLSFLLFWLYCWYNAWILISHPSK